MNWMDLNLISSPQSVSFYPISAATQKLQEKVASSSSAAATKSVRMTTAAVYYAFSVVRPSVCPSVPPCGVRPSASARCFPSFISNFQATTVARNTSDAAVQYPSVEM